MSQSRHQCPCPGCTKMVPNEKFGCKQHWYELSGEVQRGIYRTKALPPTDPKRWHAIKAAMQEWRALHPPSPASRCPAT